MARLCLLAISVSAIFGSASAENWPGWRGPRGDGTSAETGLPRHWSATDHVACKIEVPGRGHASPVVWDDAIFLVSADEGSGERLLLCLDRAHGQTRWRRTVLSSPLEDKHELNSYASSTPATDGSRVYVTFLDRTEMVVAAYDMAGELCWLVRPGEFYSKHGFCSCPVLFEDKLIVNGDHDGKAYVVALDRQTGRTIWKIDRPNNTRSYSTPLIRQIDGRTQMILSGNRCVASYDPRDGRQHWIIDGPTEQFVASVVYGRQLIFMTCGYPDHHMLAIRPDGTGNVTESHVVWRTTKGASYVPSPVAIDDYFLVVSDGGVASCFNATSGERHWMERIGSHYSASPVVAEGLVYFTSDDGVTSVIRPGRMFELVATSRLDESCYASPAISQGQFFIRGEKHLYAIGAASSSVRGRRSSFLRVSRER